MTEWSVRCPRFCHDVVDDAAAFETESGRCMIIGTRIDSS